MNSKHMVLEAGRGNVEPTHLTGLLRGGKGVGQLGAMTQEIAKIHTKHTREYFETLSAEAIKMLNLALISNVTHACTYSTTDCSTTCSATVKVCEQIFDSDCSV